MPEPSPPTEDPVLQSSRRESIFVGILFALAITYATTYCGIFGYGRDWESIRFILGFPDWIFWGVVVPWVFCVLISIWYALRYVRDEALGEEGEDPVEHQDA